jgi:hypothetical protein
VKTCEGTSTNNSNARLVSLNLGVAHESNLDRNAVRLSRRKMTPEKPHSQRVAFGPLSDKAFSWDYFVCLKYSYVPFTTALDPFDPIKSPTPVGPELSHAVRLTLPTWK